jgi:hypothetical protein
MTKKKSGPARFMNRPRSPRPAPHHVVLQTEQIERDLLETIEFEDRRGHLQLPADRLTDPENLFGIRPFRTLDESTQALIVPRQAPPPSFILMSSSYMLS